MSLFLCLCLNSKSQTAVLCQNTPTDNVSKGIKYFYCFNYLLYFHGINNRNGFLKSSQETPPSIERVKNWGIVNYVPIVIRAMESYMQ